VYVISLVHHSRTYSLAHSLAHTHAQVKKEVTDQKFYRIVSPIAGNLRCADCAQAGPDWASINLGILVCLECSGVHRSLGTHITKVRSMTLDTKSWEPELLCVRTRRAPLSLSLPVPDNDDRFRIDSHLWFLWW